MVETVLRDTGVYKDRILKEFLNSDDICELMLGKGYTEEQVYGVESDEDDFGLIYKQIFPYLYADETQTEVLSYLGFDITTIVTSPTIKDIRLDVLAYCHKDIMRYSKQGFSGTRVDILADMVERTLRKSQLPGIGEIQFRSAKPYFPNSHYYGLQLAFVVPDFKVKKFEGAN